MNTDKEAESVKIRENLCPILIYRDIKPDFLLLTTS
jgi:hypothetical protein